MTSVLEPDENRPDARGVFGRDENGGGRDLVGFDERGSTERGSTRGVGEGDDEEITMAVNKLRNRD